MDSSLKIRYEKEICASSHDSLTGLLHFGLFQMYLEQEVKRSQRHGFTFTLAVIGIDDFSTYNMRHTFLKGDRLLKDIAGLIQETIDPDDFAARYSGDIFALLLTGRDVDSNRQMLDGIKTGVEHLTQGGQSVSIGSAHYPEDGLDKDGLFQAAMKALSKVKKDGKNRVQTARTKEIETDNKPKVLVVDDDEKNVKLLTAFLLPHNFTVIKAYNGEEALSSIDAHDIDLVLLDVMMPVMDGYEVCRRIKENEETRMIPVIMVTALDDLEAKLKAIEAGTDDFITKPPNKLELMARTKSLIRMKRINNKLIGTESVLISMANAVEAKDQYTKGHISRVSNMAVSLGRKIGLTDREIEALRLGGVLHDIGKIGIPRQILNKKGPLSAEEWETIKKHPIVGYQICLPMKKILGPSLEVIRHHHERMDGSGYPDGLKGDEISIVARVMAVVDSFDAITTNRPYQKAVSMQEGLGILFQVVQEKKLDARVVEAFGELLQGFSPPTSQVVKGNSKGSESVRP
jgi:putative two-component system response regulator